MPLVNNVKICYTYDNKSRVVKKTTINLNNNSESEEVFTYDAAGNIVSDGTHSFVYGSNNRLNAVGTSSVLFDADGNMLSVNGEAYTYDSANRLINAGNNTYTYDAENTRIRNVCGDDVTVYTYNTNCKLSQLLMKTTNGVVTKYVYGLGLIGEEKCGVFKTYHFDYRGSTVAITDESGNITDTFKYDTYGKLTSHIGSSFVIFGYNGRDGVITDRNGLIYMRARYYSPELRRFVNADIIAGDITDSISLNRYAYANGNPVSLVDPLGLEAERGNIMAYEQYGDVILKALEKTKNNIHSYYSTSKDISNMENSFNDAYLKIIDAINNNTTPDEFINGLKLRIEIDPNYNTSFNEFVSEIGGFIPVLGETLSLVEFLSDEKKDASNLIDAIGSAITEKDISQLTPFTDELNRLGYVFDVLGVVNAVETVKDWNSPNKIATEITVFAQINNGASYMYQAVVDSELMFKEMYSSYTGSVIKSNANNFEIVVP